MSAILDLRGVDVADVLVISFLVHRLFLLFRGTTAVQILVAVFSLWLIYGVAQATGLVLTSWFLEKMGAVAVIAIIVVFRNEIRDVLIHTSPVRLFLGRPTRVKKVDLSAMVEAAFSLAKTRTGALLVFQNRDRLREHVRDGIHLGGLFSPQVVESIFAKQSPVHDGAAIIQGNRIDQVGAILPLSRQADLPAEYGTRHRAAIGLSEVCDAVVVVVSEERGEISVASRGTVIHADEPERLEQALHQMLRRDASPKQPVGWYWEALRQAAGFLITVALIATVWGVYSNRKLSLITITTPIDYRNIPEDLDLKSTTGEKVEVQVTGKRPLMSTLGPDQISVFIDLKSARPVSNHEVLLLAENVSVPPGVEVVKVSPSRIRISLEHRVAKTLRIEPKLMGTIPNGTFVEKTTVRPEAVKVTGPASVLGEIDHLDTEPIDLRGLIPDAPTQTIRSSLVLFPTSLRLQEGESDDIRVTIQLGRSKPAEPQKAAP